MSWFSELTIDGTNISHYYGVYVSSSRTYGFEPRDYTVVEIPGRNGDLLMHGTRLKNITVNYDCIIKKELSNAVVSVQDSMDKLRQLLYTVVGYRKIEDSSRPDEYRMGYFDGDSDVKVGTNLDYATFTLSFKCKPQRWLNEGDEGITVQISDSETFRNVTGGGAAYPLIEIPITETADDGTSTVTTYDDTGTTSSVQDVGNVDVGTEKYIRIVNDFIYVNLDGLSGTMVIDLDARCAYEKTTKTDLTSRVAATSWPVFGKTTSVYNMTGYAITVYPKWWKV